MALCAPKGLPGALSTPKRVHWVSSAPMGSPWRCLLRSDRLVYCSLRRDRQIPSPTTDPAASVARGLPPVTAPLYTCPAPHASVGQRQACHPMRLCSGRIVRSDGLVTGSKLGTNNPQSEALYICLRQVTRSGTSYQQHADVIHRNHSRFLQQVEPGTGPGIVFWMLCQM